MISGEKKFAGSSLMEGMISFRAVIAGIESGVSDRKVERVLFDREKIRELSRHLSYIRAKSCQYGFEIEYAGRAAIDALCPGRSHGGILTVCSPRTLPAAGPGWMAGKAVCFCLDGIEDPYNLGYALRSLYAAGVDGILLPPRSLMSADGVVCRASAGASEQFPMAVCPPKELLPLCRQAGIRVICADMHDSTPMWQSDLRAPLCVIVGGEKRGIPPAIRSQADAVVRIGYGRDFPAALSAASAAALIAFEVLRQSQNQSQSQNQNRSRG